MKVGGDVREGMDCQVSTTGARDCWKFRQRRAGCAKVLEGTLHKGDGAREINKFLPIHFGNGAKIHPMRPDCM